MDLVIRNATLPDGRRDIDIAVEHGRIAAVGTRLPVPVRARSTPPATWSRRRSSTRTSTWTPRSATACRA